MKVTDADRELVQELADSFDLKLDPWQERLLAIIFASHRQRDADHGQHQADSLTWQPGDPLP